MLALALGAADVRANETVRQIETALSEALQTRVSEAAQRQHWPRSRMQARHDLPPRATHLAPCPVPLAVQNQHGGPLELGRQRLQVRCDAEGGWRLDVTSDLEVWVPVVFARRPLERGETLDTGALELREVSIGSSRGHYLAIEPLAGMTAKRRIRTGQQLAPRLVAPPLLVRRGQPLKIVASVDGIAASTQGEALEDGGEGEVIRVRNTRSGKTLKAKVLEAGVVSSLFD